MVTRDVPTPQKGEMLIKVAAAAINRPDVVQVHSNFLSTNLASRNVSSSEGSEQHSGSGVLRHRRRSRRWLHWLQSGRQGVRHFDRWWLCGIHHDELHVCRKLFHPAS